MPQVNIGDDGYPVFGREDERWFLALVQNRVPDVEKSVGTARLQNGVGLELHIIICKPEVRSVFTPAVCEDLARQVAERTGVQAPLVYVADDPHPAAREVLVAAGRRL